MPCSPFGLDWKGSLCNSPQFCVQLFSLVLCSVNSGLFGFSGCPNLSLQLRRCWTPLLWAGNSPHSIESEPVLRLMLFPFSQGRLSSVAWYLMSKTVLYILSVVFTFIQAKWYIYCYTIFPEIEISHILRSKLYNYMSLKITSQILSILILLGAYLCMIY